MELPKFYQIVATAALQDFLSPPTTMVSARGPVMRLYGSRHLCAAQADSETPRSSVEIHTRVRTVTTCLNYTSDTHSRTP